MSATRPAHLRPTTPVRRRPRARPDTRPARQARAAGHTRKSASKPHVKAARVAGRRRLVVLGALFGLAALAGATLAIAHSPIFAARGIRIAGATHGEEQAILAVSGLGAHPPLIDISPAADARAIERLPWIDTARVAVSFPSSVLVTVTERVPVAFVPSTSGGALVDASGRVLADVGNKPARLVTVATDSTLPRPGGRFTSERGLFAVAAEVPTALLGRIVHVARTRQDGIVVDMKNEPLAILGSSSDARDKFVALATVLSGVSFAGITSIDLRAPSNPVLTP